jgi:hypothetical protein
MLMERSGTKMKKRYSSMGNPKSVPMISVEEKVHIPIQTESWSQSSPMRKRITSDRSKYFQFNLALFRYRRMPLGIRTNARSKMRYMYI